MAITVMDWPLWTLNMWQLLTLGVAAVIVHCGRFVCDPFGYTRMKTDE